MFPSRSVVERAKLTTSSSERAASLPTTTRNSYVVFGFILRAPTCGEEPDSSAWMGRPPASVAYPPGSDEGRRCQQPEQPHIDRVSARTMARRITVPLNRQAS